MSKKSKWKDVVGADPEPCGCRYQVRRSLSSLPLKPGQKAYRINQCAEHAPPTPDHDPYPGVPESAQYWWR